MTQIAKRQDFLSKPQGIHQALFKHALLLQHYAKALEQETETIVMVQIHVGFVFCFCFFSSVHLMVAEPDKQNREQEAAAKIADTADVA